MFALDVIRGLGSASANPFVMIDELFHSTNPSDAERSAAYFLRQLWASSGATSLISTHMFGLLAAAPDHVNRKCVYATQAPDGSIDYTYSVRDGVCMVSSVGEVWESFIAKYKSSAFSKA
jgi:DNA mismatch repair ATPase MutS